MTRYIIAATALVIAALSFGGCREREVRAGRLGKDEIMETEAPAEVFTTLVRMGRCATLVKALEVAGLAETLSGPGPFTLFAPTDEAFAALGEGRLDYLFEHPEELKAVLLRHIVGAKISSSEVAWSNTIRTITGQKLAVTVVAGTERIDGAMILERDMMATNGVIHSIDAVLTRSEGP
jgi:uncharacterized surface protein with fasciclin (FAS1) repeats